MTVPVRSLEVRSSIVSAFRRDLVGPGPQYEDLARERLSENPSRWYLTGFLAPARDADEDKTDDPGAQEEMDVEAEQQDTVGAGGAAGDDDPPEAPNTKRRFLPSS